MGTGASKNKRSNVVSSCQQPTRLTNRPQNRRASRQEKEQPEYVLLPSIKKERFHRSHNTPLNLERHQQDVFGAVPTVPSGVLRDNPTKDHAGVENSSVSLSSSSRSVTDELDDLRTELDQVLVGHYYAINKPAAGVLRTAEISVLERRNQLQPLPLDYQPVIGDNSKDREWIRPGDLVKQERDLMDRMRRERGPSKQDTKIDKETEDEGSPLIVYDSEDDQDRGDFDIQKFQAVNVPKEPIATGVDILNKTTYTNYSSTIDNKEMTPGTISIQPARISEIATTSTKPIYDPSEEDLLRDIEQELF
ncbi:uncharacterized protein LOC121406507 [Lytechinus variegatus]|uniref:uncharacterized protein LOC121406507 n=1 Tax=Lytechinus variegatus TaxID=7654 RepID=UPI001BB1D0CC|nr:uncharacterized protein LOC121406507 [Lytechinus variegatus]